jgi:tRNA(fMet)-specific endonuclease VapC
MKYLLDTNICVYYLNQREPVVSTIARVDQGDLAISQITLAELQFGAHNSEHVQRNLERVSFLENSVQVLPLDSSVTLEFARMKAELRKAGTPIDDFDLFIGATAIVNGLTLVTNNTKHFQRLGNLSLENWA